MNFLGFVKNGVTNHIYNRYRSSYQQDLVQPIKSTESYLGRVTHTEAGAGCCRIKIDDAVLLTTVSNDIRQTRLDFWNTRSIECLNAGISGIATTTVSSSVAAAYTSEALVIGSTAVAASVFACAIAVTSLALTILFFYRRSQANIQFAAWQNPCGRYQEERKEVGRKEVGKEGFLHVYLKQLKESVIHPEECRKLWISWADKMMKDYETLQTNNTSSYVVERIKTFFLKNPLNASIMNYAFEEKEHQPCATILQLSTTYQIIEKTYTDKRQEAQHRKLMIEKTKKQLIDRNDQDKKRMLKPAQTALNFMNKRALDERTLATQTKAVERDGRLKAINDSTLTQEEKLKYTRSIIHVYQNDPDVVIAETNYQDKVRRLREMYSHAVAPIITLFDKEQSKISEWAERERSKLNKAEENQIKSFAPDVKGIAKSFVEARTYQRTVEHQKEERLYPNIKQFTTTAQAYSPPPPYNPEYVKAEWDEFYKNILAQPLPNPTAPSLT